MLNALLHGGVGDIAAVCTRYFGGVKLGTGGLSRAYSGGVNAALERLATELRVDRTMVRLTIEYPSLDTVRQLLDTMRVVVADVDYGAAIAFQLQVPIPLMDQFITAVTNATQGTAVIRRGTLPS